MQGYCKYCGKKLSRKRYKNCVDCYIKNSKGEKSHAWKGGKPKCIDCGKQTSYYSCKRCKKCSNQRISKLHRPKHLRGKNNPNWNPNLTDEERNRFRFHKHISWAKSVKERDNFTCQKCKSKGKYLHSHHISSFSTDKERRYDIDNGITLCVGCHLTFHRKYGKKNNNLNQINEYLNTS